MNSEKQFCLDHSGCVAKIENNEKEIGEVKLGTLSAHKRLDGMKNWVIAGMTSLILQLILMIIGLAIISAKNNDTHRNPQPYQNQYEYKSENHPPFQVK